jgi:hypothetical protein
MAYQGRQARLQGGVFGWSVGVAVALGGGVAQAHGALDEPELDRSDEEAPRAPAAAEPAAPVEAASRPREERAMVALDVALGWGHVPFAAQNLPGPGQPYVTYTRNDSVTSNVQSLILEGSIDVVEHVGLAARLPLTFAGFSPDGSAGRSTTAFGNFEIEGQYGARVAPRLRLVASLGLALPTAQGTELPTTLDQAQNVDAPGYDRYSLSLAALAARGFEDNELFEPNRLGVVPKIALVYRSHGLSIEPYVKVDNLIGTSTTLAAPYVGDVVGAVRVGYWVQDRFELALKGIVNGVFAGTGADKQAAVAIEPSVVMRFGPVRPYAGVIVPLVEPSSESGFVAVHFGLAAAL